MSRSFVLPLFTLSFEVVSVLPKKRTLLHAVEALNCLAYVYMLEFQFLSLLDPSCLFYYLSHHLILFFFFFLPSYFFHPHTLFSPGQDDHQTRTTYSLTFDILSVRCTWKQPHSAPTVFIPVPLSLPRRVLTPRLIPSGGPFVPSDRLPTPLYIS